MYYSDKVTLVQKVAKEDASGAPILDDIGNPKYDETTTTVWADITSPSRAEVRAAGERGLKPAAVVRVHKTDYKGQTSMEIAGQRMDVYRTFHRGEDVELYVEEKRGDSRGN